MRITYLHQYYLTPEMAGGTRSYALSTRLAAMGHEVHVITSDQNPAASSQKWRVTDEGGVKVHWTPVPYGNEMSYVARLKAFLAYALRATGRARGTAGDVIFATSTPLTVAIPAILAARSKGIPMVFEVRDLWPDVPIAIGALKNPLAKFLARQLEMAAYRSSRAVVALAPGMGEAVVAKGYDEERVKIIPNGADNSLIWRDEEGATLQRQTHGWLGDRKLVVYIGSLGRINGATYLAHLAAEVRKLDPEVRFVVIGGGAEYEKVEGVARDVDVLGETFFMLGKKPKKEVRAWLTAADLSIALITGPSIVWRDATQNKFFDSLAAGTPVACNFRGWQCEIAEEEGVGFVMPADDVASGARLVVEHLHNQSWCEQAQESALRLAQGKYSMDSHAQALEKLLTGVVQADG